MQRFTRHLKTGLKVVAVSTGTVSILGFSYLQYINYKLGPINLNYEKATSYYKDKYQMT